jgi:hypothetical protein
MLSIDVIIPFVMDLRVHYLVGDRSYVRWRGWGPSKPWNINIMIWCHRLPRLAVQSARTAAV